MGGLSWLASFVVFDRLRILFDHVPFALLLVTVYCWKVEATQFIENGGRSFLTNVELFVIALLNFLGEDWINETKSNLMIPQLKIELRRWVLKCKMKEFRSKLLSAEKPSLHCARFLREFDKAYVDFEARG